MLRSQQHHFSHASLTKSALPHLSSGDTIIASSLNNAFKGNDTLIDYTATKGTIQGLVRSLVMSLLERAIRVNAVAPRPVWTPLIPVSFDDEKVASFGGQVPLKRAGQPSDMGTAYVYLACEESSYMSGQTLHLNGGGFAALSTATCRLSKFLLGNIFHYCQSIPKAKN